MDSKAKDRGFVPYDLNDYEDTMRGNLRWFRTHPETKDEKTTQEAFAERMEISQGKYQKLEAGGTSLHFDDMLAFCNIRHIQIEDLLTKPGAPRRNVVLQFTDEQFKSLRADILDVFKEAAKDFRMDHGKNKNKDKDKKHRPQGMVR